MKTLRIAVFLVWCSSFTIALLPGRAAAQGAARIGDLTVLEQDVPRRLVGYGIVVGLEGTGDRSLGGGFAGSSAGTNPTVSSVANMLRNFQIEVPAEQLRIRNVAAVLVTAEVSRYLRPGATFDIQVSSLGDATSLRGGNLFMTPLMTDVGELAVATGQGSVILSEEPGGRLRNRGGTSGRVPRGGLMEVGLAAPETSAEPILLLVEPNVTMAQRITVAINTALGTGSAVLEDPGAVRLTPTGPAADNVFEFISSVVNLNVTNETRRVVIDLRDGTVVAGGGLRVGAAAVTHSGITVSIADSTGAAPQNGTVPGLFQANAETTVQAVAEGLHATGARPSEIAAIFGALREVGALTAEVVVR